MGNARPGQQPVPPAAPPSIVGGVVRRHNIAGEAEELLQAIRSSISRAMLAAMRDGPEAGAIEIRAAFAQIDRARATVRRLIEQD